MEGQIISLYKDEVTINFFVEDDLTEGLRGLGDIVVSTGFIKDKDVFWDNIDFFKTAGKKTFKKACKEDLKDLDVDWKEVFKNIKFLLKKAKKLNLT